MSTIRCIIIDDQSQALDLMRDHISKVPFLSLALATTNPIEALTFLDKEVVDCIYLDIEMPQMSGLDFLDALKAKFGNNIPKIILITAYDRYAITGYDYGVFDYLLKPVTFKRFKISVDRLEVVSERSDEREFLFIETEGKKVKINYHDIAYIEASGNYITILTGDKKYLCYKSLTSILESLPTSLFTRVHKSFIISINDIDSIRGNEILIRIKNSVKNIPIGVTYKENLMRFLKITE